jgi:hypothetical protein
MGEVVDNSTLYERLLAAYSIPADDRATWLADMGALFDQEPYAVVEAAVERYTRDVKPAPKEYVRVPAPAAFSDWVLAAQEAADRAARKALPPPPGDRAWFRRTPWPDVWAVFARHYVAGKARARKRNALIDAYCRERGLSPGSAVGEEAWKGLDAPTEAELAAVRAQVERQGWWQRAELPPELKPLQALRGGR